MKVRATLGSVAIGLLALVGAGDARAATPDSATLDAGHPTASWTGQTGVIAGRACTAAADPTCDRFTVTVADAAAFVEISVGRDSCAGASCPLEVRVTHAGRTTLAVDEVLLHDVPAGSVLEVQVATPVGAVVGLTPYHGVACRNGCPSLPRTG